MRIFLMLLVFTSKLNESLTKSTTNFFDEYRTYDDIINVLEQIDKETDLLTLKFIGKTIEGRFIPIVKIGENNFEKKPIITIASGFYGRDWISISTSLYITYKLLRIENRHMLKSVDWHILPMMNPDGYEFTQKSVDNRLWQKNRSKHGLWYGVDLERNFNFHWREKNSSDNPFHRNYAGPSPFSEIETYCFQYYANIFKDMIKLYVNLYSYGTLLTYPNAYKKVHTKNHNELQYLGEIVAKEMRMFKGNRYTVGMSSEVQYEASGGSADWMKNILNVSLVYNLHITGGGRTGYDPPPYIITIRGKEIFIAFKKFLEYVEITYKYSIVSF